MKYVAPIIFAVATVVFALGALQNFFLYRMYHNAYQNIKRSKIVETLTNLFFWKMFAFIFLVLISFAQFAGNSSLGIVLRGIGIIPFIFVVYYLNEFAKWSTENDGEMLQKQTKEVRK